MTARPAPAEFDKAIRSAGAYGRELVEWRASWLSTARPKQLAPPGQWDIWANIAGRGWGKTRIGAEDAGYYAASNAGVRVCVAGPTRHDIRSVCFEGESGLDAVIPSFFKGKDAYNKSTLELTLTNGSKLIGISAEKPDRFRGPQFHRAWCDELASWGAVSAGAGGKKEGHRLKEAWDNLQFGLRLGKHPQAVITTTPRPIDFLRKLVKDPRCRVRSGSTFENSDNLAANSLAAFRSVYEGTSKGRQELYAEILENSEGTLWTWAQLDAPELRLKDVPASVELVRTVVAADPAVTSAENSDEWGIIVASLGSDGRVYVVADRSAVLAPRAAARAVLQAYERFDADCVVAETNQGGDLVGALLDAEAGDAPFRLKTIHAKRGKYLRAEPVAALYEKGKVSHVGNYSKLEKQMVEFTGSTSDGSPDRLDALVYAVSELAFGTIQHDFF